VRNEGPNASTDTLVQVDWTRPGTNGASSYAFTLSSNTGSCVVGPNSGSSCSIGTLGVGASTTIEFRGTTSTDFIGVHNIVATATNAENAMAFANGSVATVRSILCVGDCGDDSVGGGGSTGVLSLGALLLLLIGRRRTHRRRFAA
jgi:hypothetical protein